MPNQRKGLDLFFSIFYIAINAGALISGIATPYMRQNLVCFGSSCYFSAFMLCSATFVLAMGIFILGEKHYRIVPPRGEFLPYISACITFDAVIKWCKATPAARKEKKSFLDFAGDKFSSEMVRETALLGNLILLLTPIIFYWSVYDQGGNEWQYQYNMMRPSGIPVEAFGTMNTIFVLILVPSMVYVYQMLEKRGIRFTILQRMGLGFTLMTIAYGISGIMQIFVIRSFIPGVTTSLIDHEERCTDMSICISAWWLTPQWFLLSLGEALISPEGLKLTYMNVGPLMKSQSLAIWLMMSGLGSLFTLVITKFTENLTYFNDFTSDKALR